MKDGLDIDKDGTKRWYLNGKLHREDGPAIEYTDGNKFWCLNGKLHRTDGPACEYFGGYKQWYINNESLSQEEYLHRTRKKKLELLIL